MGVLLKIILISVLVYYIFKTAFRLFLPFLGKKFEQEIYKRTQTQEKINREGEVSIHINKNKSKKIDKDFGEYTDFEEIE
ncbi:MAG: DUF4834 family protein [Bacteroidales bacterium]|nr:DUF4834 family protein [Bacteroidales bacterium]